ncbi:hypothetical protein C0995_002038 [Termitomyces sp. Mi166|nr:hypothetical protein C0995_002038 [Termitomyces sp. Mi166\
MSSMLRYNIADHDIPIAIYATYTYSPPSAVYATAKTLRNVYKLCPQSFYIAEELHFNGTNFIMFRDRIFIVAQFCGAHGYLEGMVPKPGSVPKPELQTEPTMTPDPDNVTTKKVPLAKVPLAKTKPDDAKGPTE